jgi:PKD repeat protein
MPTPREILTTKRLESTEQYSVGDLSIFPEQLDDTTSLYQTRNNSITVLTGKLDITSDLIHVHNTLTFPEEGIVRINDELIYYREKTDKFFQNLIRGFNQSRKMTHSAGAVVLGCVSSLHHNAVRDSIVKTQTKTGLISDVPDINGSLTSRVKFLDIKWFTPVARFYANPRWGLAPLTVNFRNFSLGDPYIRSVWDFGDSERIGDISAIHPVHVYQNPGLYTVSLTIQDSDGRSSNFAKRDYIKVFDLDSVLHVLAYPRNSESKVKLTIDKSGRPEYDTSIPLSVEFVDQTIGMVVSRQWIFGDGESLNVESNPYDHIAVHNYTSSGVYWPELKVIDQNGAVRFYKFPQPIIVGFDFRELAFDELIFGNVTNTDISLSRPVLDQKQQLSRVRETLDSSLVL